MKRCVACNGTLKLAETEDVITLGEHQITLTLPAHKCSSCGEVYVEGSISSRAELLVASQVLDLGITTGAAFRFMRKALGLRATDLAALFGVNPATISRWETDKVAVDHCAFAALAAAATERLHGHDSTLSRLRALHAPKTPSKTLRLDFAKAA